MVVTKLKYAFTYFINYSKTKQIQGVFIVFGVAIGKRKSRFKR